MSEKHYTNIYKLNKIKTYRRKKGAKSENRVFKLLNSKNKFKMGKCVYCKADIGDGRSVDVCDRCGVKVWGEKMFRTIITNMDNAKEKGDLMQGSVSAECLKKPDKF